MRLPLKGKINKNGLMRLVQVPSIAIRIREADLAAVTENSAAAQVDFAHVVEVSRRSSEFSCAAFQVQRNGDDGENSLGEWNSGGGSGVEK